MIVATIRNHTRIKDQEWVAENSTRLTVGALGLLAVRNKSHSTAPHELMAAAAEAGWVLLRFELIPNTNHYLTMFVQKELFDLERHQRGRRQGRELSPRS